jgi:predicted AAA+ superfamily ATPase
MSMKRHRLDDLLAWQRRSDRKPLLVRGARQVGKSYMVREFGRHHFRNVIELNFEMRPDLAGIFAGSLDPERLLRDIKIASQDDIRPGETLLFFDEVQLVPQALTALRYFYEHIPDLHVIAAGSLLEFAIEEVGLPVGRVESLYLYPMTFEEFLEARQKHQLLALLREHHGYEPLSVFAHQQLLTLFFEYLAVGGMPEAVSVWSETQDLRSVARIHSTLVENYRQDFPKYARRAQVKYVDLVFQAIPRLLGRKFVYSHIDPSIKSRDLKGALQLLSKASVAHVVHHSSANGIPLGAEGKADVFKVIFLDVALAQTLLGLQPGAWILDPKTQFANRGPIIESFVGQELLAHHLSHSRAELFYWVKEKPTSLAEVDYLCIRDGKILPIEVKSGSKRRSKSIQIFLSEKTHVKDFFQISIDNFQRLRGGINIPVYAVETVIKMLRHSPVEYR